MTSYSFETQQNGNSQPENSKIAQIYQRMLLGEKSALATLQKIKTHTPKQFIQLRRQSSSDQQSPQFTRKKNMNRTEIQRKTQSYNPNFKDSPFDRIKTINQEPLQESMIRQRQKDKQKEKLKSYIKRKLNELRSEKEILRSQEEKEIHEIKKINDNQKTNTINQSKSYDLVKKKQLVQKTANATNTGMSTTKEQAKKIFQNIQIHQSIKKTQSSSKPNPNKQLPPLKQKKKIPTQISQNNHDLAESKVISRKDLRTPINLADSTLKMQLKHVESIQSKNKDSHSKSTNGNISEPGKNKRQESRVTKISLPEMRRMREQYALINEQQKSAQLDVMQHHQHTRHFIQEVKIRNQLNYRNHERLNEIKKFLNPEPVLNTFNTKKTIPSSLKEQHEESKKKKQFVVNEQKIHQAFEDIKLIEEAIAKKKAQVTKIQEKLQHNLLIKFWNEYDLQMHDFTDDDDLPQIEIYQPQNISESKITQAYSTAMPETKDKKWKRKAIKQYDNNRSFHEYAKSRSQFNPVQGKEKQNNLNQIEQNDQDEQEENGENRVTVNSRLKKLLLQ